ncbi:MAG: hypothetical protein NC253_01390 [Ruminococcus sp.]|nr:hypothetical protein [Ruminococcus sp.]MCM1380921.1 hypothetical protein [Muribaculaceae bacterium]
MFDNLKFTLADSSGNCNFTELTALGLISLLYHGNLLIPENAYGILDFLAKAEPKDKYSAGSFTIIVLPH